MYHFSVPPTIIHAVPCVWFWIISILIDTPWHIIDILTLSSVIIHITKLLSTDLFAIHYLLWWGICSGLLLILNEFFFIYMGKPWVLSQFRNKFLVKYFHCKGFSPCLILYQQGLLCNKFFISTKSNLLVFPLMY